MNMPGGMEWVLIAVVALLIFGPKKLPDLARGIGEAITEFRKSMSGATAKEDESSKQLHSAKKEEDKTEHPAG